MIVFFEGDKIPSMYFDCTYILLLSLSSFTFLAISCYSFSIISILYFSFLS